MITVIKLGEGPREMLVAKPRPRRVLRNTNQQMTLHANDLYRQDTRSWEDDLIETESTVSQSKANDS